MADMKNDRTYGQGLHTVLKYNTYKALYALFEKYNVLDCWSQLHPPEKDYTYFSSRYGVHTILNYFLLSKADVNKLRSAEIGTKTRSNHSWVACEFCLQDFGK